MDMPKPGQVALDAFEQIATDLSEEVGAQRVKMMGMPSLKHDGKMFLGVWADDMVFKLAGESHGQAIALEGTRLFDPSGQGRPMKAWVAIPPRHKSDWAALARQAFESRSAA
jgi:TfoX N-terminal domain